METIFIYFLKVNIALAVFYITYRLIFHKDTFFQLRRFTLLAFFAIALIYPFWEINEQVKTSIDIQPITVNLPEILVSASETAAFPWTDFLFYGYLSVGGLLLLRFVIQLSAIFRIIKDSKTAIINGKQVHLLEKPASPFSFFKWIFIHPQGYKEEEVHEIITHETVHQQQLHSLDVIICELFTACCWINPFVWLLGKEMRNNHEYLADDAVVRSGFNTKNYQYHLLEFTNYKTTAVLYNYFNVLSLKSRINMMNKKRTNSSAKVKYLLLLPLTAALAFFGNNTAEASAFVTKTAMAPDDNPGVVVKKSSDGKTFRMSNIDDPSKIESRGVSRVTYGNKYTIESRVMPAGDPIEAGDVPQDDKKYKTADGEEVLNVCDELPSFPGGNQKLFQYLGENIQYPVEAQKNKIEGRVFLEFFILKDGSVSEVKVIRSANELLDKEAIRVVESMPKWTPGKNKGEPVNVRYVLPVIFKLQKPQ